MALRPQSGKKGRVRGLRARRRGTLHANARSGNSLVVFPLPLRRVLQHGTTTVLWDGCSIPSQALLAAHNDASGFELDPAQALKMRNSTTAWRSHRAHQVTTFSQSFPIFWPCHSEIMDDDDQGAKILVTTWTLTGLSGFFLAVRLACKLRTKRRFWWDDHVLVLSWVSRRRDSHHRSF
jgi:hypothetical protein